MKTNQLLARSAVTLVATGLTLLTSTHDAHGRGSSRGGMSAGHGSMPRGAIHNMSSRAGFRSGSAVRMEGRNQMNNRGTGNTIRGTMRDDRGGHGERRHGRDDGIGHNGSIARGQRERGDDHGRHREPGDDKGGMKGLSRGERQPGDDHGRHRESGDDKGGTR